MKLPQKIVESLSKSTKEQKELFQSTYNELEKTGLYFHSDKPDFVMATHPKNDINFLAIRYGTSKGTVLEIRIDSCPVDFLSMRNDTKIFEVKMKHWDSGKKPLWAIYYISNQSDIEEVIVVIKRIMNYNPSWGR